MRYCELDVEAGFGGCGEAVLGVAAGPWAPSASGESFRLVGPQAAA